MENASGDYRFWLDEGDTFETGADEDFRTLRRALRPDIAGVCVKHDFLADAPGTAAHYRYELRAVERGTSFRFQDNAHPFLMTDGKTAVHDLTLLHRQDTPPNDAPFLPFYRSAWEKEDLYPRERLFLARALRDSGDRSGASDHFHAVFRDENAPRALRLSACLEESLLKSDPRECMDILLDSLRFSRPQGDLACLLGSALQKEKPHEAAYWYRLALSERPPVSSRDIYADYWGYVPALELCRCSFALGDAQKAEEYNRLAGRFHPDDPIVRYNDAFFSSRRKK